MKKKTILLNFHFIGERKQQKEGVSYLRNLLASEISNDHGEISKEPLTYDNKIKNI